MKPRFHATLLLGSLLLTCRPVQAATNFVDDVLAEGKFQWDAEVVRPVLGRAISSAALVVKARVVNSETAVQASPGQQEVSTGQGWGAALVQTTRVFKGDPKASLLWVANMAFRGAPAGLHWRHPVEATNGQECILILEKDERLSRWCQTNVFAVIRGLEVEASNPQGGANGSQPSSSHTNSTPAAATSRRSP